MEYYALVHPDGSFVLNNNNIMYFTYAETEKKANISLYLERFIDTFLGVCNDTSKAIVSQISIKEVNMAKELKYLDEYYGIIDKIDKKELLKSWVISEIDSIPYDMLDLFNLVVRNIRTHIFVNPKKAEGVRERLNAIKYVEDNSIFRRKPKDYALMPRLMKIKAEEEKKMLKQMKKENMKIV